MTVNKFLIELLKFEFKNSVNDFEIYLCEILAQMNQKKLILTLKNYFRVNYNKNEPYDPQNHNPQ